MNKMLNKLRMKSMLLAGAVAMPALSLLAQDSTQSTLDTTQASNAANTIKEGLVSLLETVAPVIVDVILAVLGVVVIYKIVRWLMRAFNTRG